MIRRLSSDFAVSHQIAPGDCAALAEEGFGLVVNNRPDGEDAGQPAGAAIEAAARAAGLDYRLLPFGATGLEPALWETLAEAIEAADRPVLAFCRTGTRSTHLWALAMASRGRPAAELVEAARHAGHDLRPLAPMLARVAGKG